MKNTVVILCIAMGLQPCFCAAQGEGWNWYFGAHAGLDFSSGYPVPLTNSALSSYEGTSAISDASGQLLFYTNGLEVADASHNLMPNGIGLAGDSSSAQGAIIVQQPMSDSLFYLFNVDYNQSSNSAPGQGFTYSIVDMSLNGGLGDVTVKNEPVRPQVREKITALRHANGVDYWIVIIDWIDDEIYAYLFDANGLSMTPVISNVGPFHNGQWQTTTGYLKASRQNDRIASATWNNDQVIVADFNRSTGVADNRQEIGTANNGAMANTYGIEFSPDGSKLYTSTLANPHKILQFDLSLVNGADMFAARDTVVRVVSAVNYYFGALQVGPDGKIYCAVKDNDSLSVINEPNEAGALCNYGHLTVPLDGRFCRLGLPNFVSDVVIPTGIMDVPKPTAVALHSWFTSGMLTVTMPAWPVTSAIQVAIHDATGCLVYAHTLPAAPSLSIDLGELASGAYSVRLHAAGRSAAGRFVVN